MYSDFSFSSNTKKLAESNSKNSYLSFLFRHSRSFRACTDGGSVRYWYNYLITRERRKTHLETKKRAHTRHIADIAAAYNIYNNNIASTKPNGPPSACSIRESVSRGVNRFGTRLGCAQSLYTCHTVWPENISSRLY